MFAVLGPVSFFKEEIVQMTAALAKDSFNFCFLKIFFHVDFYQQNDRNNLKTNLLVVVVFRFQRMQDSSLL